MMRWLDGDGRARDADVVLNTGTPSGGRKPRAVAAGDRLLVVWEAFHSRQLVAVVADAAGRISAPKDAFVGLIYYNPPGGIKHCLNSKLASCEVTVTDKVSGRQEPLTAKQRAALEILTDDLTHGVAIQV